MRAPITPIPIDTDAPTRTLILFGGTFDPPHVGHTQLASRVLELFPGARMCFVPVARSPHKATGPVASNQDRVRMLELALRDVRDVSVWTDEIDRAADDPETPSYTSDTVERATRWLDDNTSSPPTLRLLLGSDQAAAFHRWHEPRKIIETAEPIVLLRRPIDTTDKLSARLRDAKFWSQDEAESWLGRVVKAGLKDVSATQLRHRLARDPGADGLEDLLDPRVLTHIREHHLYTDS